MMSWLSCDCHPMHTGSGGGGGRGSKGRRNGGSSGEKTTRGVRPIGHANRTTLCMANLVLISEFSRKCTLTTKGIGLLLYVGPWVAGFIL